MVKRKVSSRVSVTIAVIGLVLSFLLYGLGFVFPNAIVSPLLFLLALPGYLLSLLFPSATGDAWGLLVSYLNFSFLGLLVGFIAYRKYRKAVYWSLTFTVFPFLGYLFMSLLSDAGPLEQQLPALFSFLFRLLFVVSAPVGYFIGVYLGAKISQSRRKP